MGRELVQKVALANWLKNSKFKPPDKTPHTYDQQVIKLNGCIALDIMFRGKTIKTMIYVKMDASERLLLGEGMCRQLRIVTYHGSVHYHFLKVI